MKFLCFTVVVVSLAALSSLARGASHPSQCSGFPNGMQNYEWVGPPADGSSTAGSPYACLMQCFYGQEVSDCRYTTARQASGGYECRFWKAGAPVHGDNRAWGFVSFDCGP